MGKITKITDVYVEVHPLVYSYNEENDAESKLRACNEIMDAIKRHVDDIDHCEIHEEVEECCEYCGYKWTGDNDHYNGGCCEEDEKNKEGDK
jgi:nitrate reductase NapAB chaperone NapD